MSKEEIKSLLHESIENIDDDDFLLSVKEIIDCMYLPSEIPVISENRRKRIFDSNDQIEKGNFITNEEADKLVDEWLRNKN
ncbi:MAG: hypothetical protein WAT71_17115 [Ignavibacteria bacterium]